MMLRGSCWGRYFGIGYHPGSHPGYEHIARIAASWSSCLQPWFFIVFIYDTTHVTARETSATKWRVIFGASSKNTLPSLKLTAKAPENWSSQRETSIPTINFQVRAVSFNEGSILDEGDLLPWYFMQMYAWETHRQKDFIGLDVTEMNKYQGCLKN